MTRVPAVRRRTMQAVRSKNTKPEMLVRRALHAKGFRYRLHLSELPGKPDICFPARKKVIFVHGCFWHGHDCPRGDRTPKTNVEYWTRKVERNRARDEKVLVALKEMGWESFVVWECELRDPFRVLEELGEFLSEPPPPCHSLNA